MKKSIAFAAIFSLLFLAPPTQAATTSTVKNCVNLKTGTSRYVTNTVKKCKVGEKLINISYPVATGTIGKNGSTIIAGDGAPSTTIGIEGDFYFDNTNKRMYGSKSDRLGWGLGFSVVGPSGGGGGGTGPQGPKGDTGATGAAGGFGDYGSFYDTSTVNLAANTATPIPVNTTDLAKGISIANGSKIKFAHPGIYNIAFSTQLLKSDNQTDIISIWLAKNGTGVPWTNTDVYMIGSGARQIAAWNFFVNVATADITADAYWQLMISAGTSTGTQILSTPAATSPTRPQIPGTILTINQVG